MTKNEIQPGVDAGGVDALIRASLAGKRDWRVLARIILECERDGLWKGKASSFSAWLKLFAEQLGIQISNLWRYRRAGKAAFVFWGDQGQCRIKSLEDMPDGISPESIEILDKISRAAPAYLVKQLSTRLFEKDIPMRELRALWKKFRSSLQGDARGRSKIAPALSRSDSRRRASLLEELAAGALSRLRVSDVCSGEGSIKVLSNVIVMGGGCEVDIAMVTSGKVDGVEIHGVVVLTQVTPGKVAVLQRLKRYCDYVWVVLPDSPTAEVYRCLDEEIGLFQVRELKADIIRKAKKIYPDTGDVMARSVISKLMC